MNMNENAALRNYWESEYRRSNTPFDIADPDEWIASLEREGRICGNILDCGCGPGRTAIYLSAHGYGVTGVDISERAIDRAKRKAAERKLDTQFICSDIRELRGYDGYFNIVVDIGCLHSLFDENDRCDYAASLHRLCCKNAIIYLRAISNANLKSGGNSAKHGIPAMSERQIRDSFQDGWQINDLNQRETNIMTDNGYKKACCWFAEILRTD
jgi:2-polyprenyl-3-methyl-5-hydroxy-6-metoxy-1,4-benzoquinol methylase